MEAKRLVGTAAAVVLAALAGTSAHAQQAVVGVADLQAAVAKYRNATGDQFTPKPTQEDLIGRRFRVSVHFPQLLDHSGPRMGEIGGWSYDPEEGQITLEPWIEYVIGTEMTSDPSLDSIHSRFSGFVVRSHSHYVGKVAERSAYGADVDVHLGDALTIAAYVEGLNHGFPDVSDKPPPAKVAMAPADARDVTPHLALVVEGEIAAYKGKRAIACGTTGTIATINNRTESTFEECVVSARIDRYAIEDERNGRVVAEWKRPAPEAMAPPSLLQGDVTPTGQVQAMVNAAAASAAARGGIGITFILTPDGMTLVSVAPNSPAAVAGLTPLEKIDAVNGTSVKGIDRARITDLLARAGPSLTFSVVGVGDVKIVRSSH